MKLKRVVITGLGTVNPLGNGVESFFSSLDRGVSGCSLIERFDATLFKSKFACTLKDFVPSEYGIDRKEVNKCELYSLYAQAAAVQAVSDSGIADSDFDPAGVGVIIGSGVGGIETYAREIRDYSPATPPRFSPYLIPKFISNIVPGTIAIRHKFRGPSFSVSSACASSTHAIITSCSMIQLGRADVVVTGGAESCINVAGIGGFNALKALSTNNEEYMSASRPFDVTRDGFVMGEGAAILVVEEYEHAVRRGAKIYAEITGCGLSTDAYHITAPDPSGRGEIEAMQMALSEAHITPSDVDYINLHGTSTKIGDVVETNAIKDFFGDASYNVSLSSTKSMTGHLLGAAGAVEVLCCIHAIRDGIIPPTINFREKDPQIDYKLDFTFNKAVRREVNVALTNNFGFGGHNACLVLKKVR